MRKFLLLLFVAIWFIVAPKLAAAFIQIDSVKTTASACMNNGSITIYATTNRPALNYSIIAGPVTRTQQTNNTFSSLPAGIYTVKVVNSMLESAVATVNVRGSYVQPTFTPLKINPYCFGASNGTLIGNLTQGTGTAPYTWQLIAPSQVTTLPQLNDTFNNLPAGSYSVRVTDACGNYLTYETALFNPITQPILGDVYIEVIGCDSTQVLTYIKLPENGIRIPLRFKYQTKNGVFIPSPDSIFLNTANINQSPYGTVSAKQILPGISYGDTIITTIYNTCGDSIVSVKIIPPFKFTPSYTTIDCSIKTNVNFNFSASGSTYGVKAPFKYIYSDSITGFIIDSATILRTGTDPLSIINKITIRDSLTAGNTYTLTVTDGCGRFFQENFRVPEKDTLGITGKVILNSACIDSLVGIFRIQIKGFNGPTRLTLLSGPPTAGSSSPGFSYSHNHTFPYTINGGEGQNRYYLRNLAPGTWHFKIEDNCGNILNDSFTINNNEVTGLGKSVSYRKGCLGKNTIIYSLFHDTNNVARSYSSTVTVSRLSDGVVLKNQYYYTNAVLDSLPNLPSGSYIVSFQFRNESIGTYIGPVDGCTIISDTIIIEEYTSPSILINSNSISCNNFINIELLPDSSKGVPPYQYEIIGGPSTFPLQASNIFTGSIRGVYTARIYDACGNASTTSIFADTVSFSPLGAIKIGCYGMKFFYTISQHYTYTWITHGNTVFTGDTLVIDSITNADTGVYIVTKIIDVNGCRDTFYTSFNVELPGIFKRSETICEGDSLFFGGRFYTSPGTYYDSLFTIDGCDSVVILNLTVNPYKRDTLNITICEGSSYLFNSINYSSSGNYSDTLTTTSCDSIVMLNLTVNPYKRDTLHITICEDQNYIVGTSIYSSSGTYVDTLTTTGCDSIVMLNLTVNPYKRDTLHITICEDQNYIVGTSVYSSSGTYVDTLTTTGCDSIVVLNLTVNPYKRDTLNSVICEGQSFTVSANNYSLSGTYIDTLHTTGCDSIVLLNLTVNPYKRDTLNISLCNGQVFNIGTNIYTSTGTYSDTLHTIGCDSIVLLNLTVNDYKRQTLNITICEEESYMVGTNTYTTTGTYSDTLTTISCDSIVTLNLTINSFKRDTLSVVICEGQTITVGANNYLNNGTYIDTLTTAGCDSIVILNLTVNPYKRDTLHIVICEGQNVSVGMHNYFSTGIYNDTISTLNCDSIVILNLTVNPYKRDTINTTICEGQSFTVGSNSYGNTGTYIDTLTTAGCDSIVMLNLMVHPYKRDTFHISLCTGQSFFVGTNSYSSTGIYTDTLTTTGCDSIVLLHLLVNDYKRDTLHISICEEQSYSVGTSIYSTAGIFSDTLSTASCDSIVTLYLTVNSYKRDTLHVTICEGQGYTVGTRYYSSTGYYIDTLTTTGCDSIVMLNLMVNPYKRDTLNSSICEGQSFTVGLNSYSSSGIYIDTLTTAGCDSIIVLNLIVTPYKRDTISTTICEGQSFTVGANTYILSGTYTDTLPTLGCDSIVMLNLVVTPYKRDTLNSSICEGQSFTVGINSYTLSGTYTDTLSTAGCDSIVMLNLVVTPYKRDTLNVTICEGQNFTVGINSYTLSGTYTDTLSTAGCDSIVTLNLIVNPYKRSTINTTICEGQSFAIGVNNYSLSGTYTDTLSTATCDSIVIVNLSVNPYKRSAISATICEGNQYFFNHQNFSQAGIYYDTLTTTGCDSIVTLTLTVSPYKRGDTTEMHICQGEMYTFNGNAYTETGIYFDTLSTNTCDSIVALSLIVHPAPSASITATPQAVNPGGAVELKAPFASAYLWQTTARINDDSTIQNISAVFYTSSWVYLTTTNTGNNCSATDSVYISVRTDTVIVPPCGPNTYIYLPNAFVPGSNFGNGIFRIFSSNIRLVQFQVFNKWGNTVFATTNITEGWNGLYKGRITPGNYVYRVAYYDCNPNLVRVKAGNILLLK